MEEGAWVLDWNRMHKCHAIATIPLTLTLSLGERGQPLDAD
jgi:hypothetical protein